MRGLNVNGFVIVETLGSGRSGLLYLARHPSTGQEAIIRLAGNAEDGMTAKVFLEEAASLLPTARDVEPQVASDGSRVLMALGASSIAPTLPLPQPATDRLSGHGATQHAHTQRLSDSSLTRSAPLLLVFIGLAALAAAVTVLILVTRGATPSPAPVMVVPPAPPRVPVVIAPPPVEPALVVQPPSAPARAPSRPVVARPAAPALAPKTTAICDLRWQRAANTELSALRLEVARRDDDALFRRYEDDEDRVVVRMQTLPIGEECQAVDAALDALLAKYRP
ncbi:MAG: hypothetical protein Q8S33_36025 [Myxococcales bacterium]|nr:hypothetical protein [Myxococcales bacterium]MDP3505808.1 hypothetical protein [Myxococcales bacterium]